MTTIALSARPAFSRRGCDEHPPPSPSHPGPARSSTRSAPTATSLRSARRYRRRRAIDSLADVARRRLCSRASPARPARPIFATDSSRPAMYSATPARSSPASCSSRLGALLSVGRAWPCSRGACTCSCSDRHRRPLFGWFAPSIILSRRIRTRFQQIDQELPELIDLLVVTVEAGIGFNGSLRMAAEELRRPARPGASTHPPGAEHGPLHDRGDRQPRLARRHARDEGVRPRDHPGRDARRLDQSDPPQPRRRDAQETEGDGGGAGAEGADQDAVPAHLPDLPRMFVVLLLPAILAISNTLGWRGHLDPGWRGAAP